MKLSIDTQRYERRARKILKRSLAEEDLIQHASVETSQSSQEEIETGNKITCLSSTLCLCSKQSIFKSIFLFYTIL